MKIELSAFEHIPNTLQVCQISKNYKCEIHSVTFEYEAPLEILIRCTQTYSQYTGIVENQPKTLVRWVRS